jgi:tetratricopeptide (TPR) repeat protein
VLELPLTTKARELIALAQKDHQIGLLPEALEKFLAAEQLNKVNFPLQLQIGKLFLYGKNKQDSVIDLTKAAQHLLLAARYAGTETKWAKCRGEALFHAATAFYLIGGQETNVVNSETARQCLESALLQLRSAIDSWPVFTESYYLAAKCRVLLGQREEALEDLEILSDRDRRYFVKMGKDKDFDPVRAEAEKVFRNAITNPGFQARATQAKLSELREKLTELREEFDCFEPAEPKCREELALIEPTKALLKRATALLSKRATVSLSAIDANIEGILSGLLSVQTSLDEASRSLKEATKNAIIDCDATLRARDIGIVWPQNQLPNVMHGSFRWDPARVQLELYHLKLGHHLATDPPDFTLHSFGKLRFELGHRLVLGANVLDHLVAHPHQIPEEWQTNLLEGLPKEATFCPTSILFLGTIYTSGDCLDRLSVRSLSLSRLYKTESWKWAEFLAYQISGEPAPQVNIQKGLYVSEGTYYVALLAG